MIEATILRERLMATLSGFFGLLALLLGCIGLYGILSYSVASRTNEIGIRMALGAQARNVRWLITARGVVAGYRRGGRWIADHIRSYTSRFDAALRVDADRSGVARAGGVVNACRRYVGRLFAGASCHETRWWLCDANSSK